MASSLRQLFHLFALITVIYQTAFCSILRIETISETFNKLITNEINITCTLDDPFSRVKEIIIIGIERNCKDSIAILHQSEVSDGDHLKANMQANGHIEQNANTSLSFLRLTIKNPGIEDNGAYSCLVFYQDELGKVKEERASVNVTVDKDYQKALIYLMNKVETLEKTVNRQQVVINEQINKTQMQENVIKDQTQVLYQQDVSISECKLKIDNQGKQLQEQKDQIAKVYERDSYMSAFSVGYDGEGTFGAGDTLVFSNLIMQTGDAYNMTTGVFTAPRNGYYVFHLDVTSFYSISIQPKTIEGKTSSLAGLVMKIVGSSFPVLQSASLFVYVYNKNREQSVSTSSSYKRKAKSTE